MRFLSDFTSILGAREKQGNATSWTFCYLMFQNIINSIDVKNEMIYSEILMAMMTMIYTEKLTRSFARRRRSWKRRCRELSILSFRALAVREEHGLLSALGSRKVVKMIFEWQAFSWSFTGVVQRAEINVENKSGALFFPDRQYDIHRS